MDIPYNTYSGFANWFRYYLFKYIPVSMYPFFVKKYYKQLLGKNLNLKNPVTLSEKINYLKLYDLSDKKTVFTDKLLAKEYVKNNVPELKVAELYKVYSTFDDIDFSNLPNQFIIKTNHACKTGIVVEDKKKLDFLKIKTLSKYYNKVLNIDYAFWGIFELQYKNIVPKVYIEELLIPKPNSLFKEYEIYCLNGNVEFIQYCVCTNDGLTYRTYYDKDFKEADFAVYRKMKSPFIPDEKNKEKLIEYAQILSSGFPFVRVDIFEVNEILYFGEMTFTPHCGNIPISPSEYDAILGNKLDISGY